MRTSSPIEGKNKVKPSKTVSAAFSSKNIFFKPANKLSVVKSLKDTVTKPKIKQRARIKRIEEDLKKIKLVKEREKESKLYSTLISGAFICLILALSLWYSINKMKSAFTDLEEFTGSGLGLAEPILSKLMFLFEIIFYLSILGFVIFLIAIVCKKYQLYEKYVKPRIKARLLRQTKKAGQKTEAAKDLPKLSKQSVLKKSFSSEKPSFIKKPASHKPTSSISSTKLLPKKTLPNKAGSFLSKITGFEKKGAKKTSKKTPKQSLLKKKDNPFLK